MTETASAVTINTDVVIIGGGVMGASIALELSKAGRKVVVIEHRRQSFVLRTPTSTPF